MEVSQAIGLLGIYLTLMSILVVYKILRLQTWIEGIDDIEAEVSNRPDKFQGATNRERRHETKEKILNLRNKYPSLSDYTIFFFFTFLSILGIWISCLIKKKISIWFTGIPVSIFWVVIFMLEMLFIRSSRKKLNEIEEKLNKWEK